MSFQANKDDLVTRLGGLGFTESQQIVDFENAPSSEYGNTYIIRIPETELLSADETLSDRIRDDQLWEIQIAFDRSAFNEAINRDDLHRTRERIVKDLDDPANWGTGVFKRRYQSSTVNETDNYFVLTINLQITDQISY